MKSPIAALLTAVLLLLTAMETLEAQPLPPGTRVERDLAYGPDPARNLLDLYMPPGGGPRPVIVWIHGGGWRQGDKGGGGAARRQLPRGYAVAAIHYRFSHQAPWPAQIEDCQLAVRWLRAHAADFGLDPDRIAAWGSSAGGHLAAMLGSAAGRFPLPADHPLAAVSDRVQAVVDFYGPSDLLAMDDQALRGSRMRHGAAHSPESLLVGGQLEERPEAARSASPRHHVSPQSAPHFIVHGEDDPVVPPGQSEVLHAALQAAGVESHLHLLPGARHGGPEFAALVPHGEIDAFLDRHLRPQGR